MRLPSFECAQRLASEPVASMQMAMVRTAVATRLQVVERTLRSFVHSERRTPANEYRPGGKAGRVVTGSSPLRRCQPVAGGAGIGHPGVVDVELDAVAGELHESVLEGRQLG